MYISKLISDNRMFFFNFSSNEKKWHFVAKSVLTYSEKKNLVAENLQNFDITRTISSNSERSEQFWATECFFNLFLEVSQIEEIRTIRIQIGKN